MIVANPERSLADLVSESEIDLDRAALLIAAEEYPDLDVDLYLGKLDCLGREAQRSLPLFGGTESKLSAAVDFLFSRKGFVGNTEAYYDPRNSYLNEVIDRRAGIPITLAIVLMEVGRRLGIDLRGVVFPGHFLTRLIGGRRDLIIDPFFGQIVERDQWRRRLEDAYGTAVAEIGLRDATPREILVRLLGNLKHIYVVSGQLPRALRCCERILLIDPTALYEIRDRGFIHQSMECYLAARRDFETFLRAKPDDRTAAAVKDNLELVEEQIGKFQ